MQYVVEASLKRGKPRLRVIDAATGQTRLEWGLVKVNEMLETGEISQEEFLRPERYGMKLLVKNLFLLSCADGLSISPECNQALGYKVEPK